MTKRLSFALPTPVTPSFRFTLLPFVLLVVLAAVPSPVLASDGVLEINHTCATTTGCFTGDTAGYPVTITGVAGRSYILTSDLKLPTDTTGIEISTSNALVDLNGFTITRACFFTNTAGGSEFCFIGSVGDGVRAVASDDEYIEVRNGSIAFLGGNGVTLRDHSVARGLRISRMDGPAIVGGDGMLIEDNVIENVAGQGIVGAGVIRNNSVYEATGNGIESLGFSTISNNTVISCGGNGISAQNSAVRGNSAVNNTLNGITISGGTVVENTSEGNTLDGIRCQECTALGNHLESNSGAGIQTTSTGAYGSNWISGGTTVAGAMIQVDLNVCNGNTTCP